MLYLILILLTLLAIILVVNSIKKSLSAKKKLAFINEKWGCPVDETRNFKQIGRYLATLDLNSNMSAETAGDLDINSLFSFMDRTNSKPGQQYLYKKLHILDPGAEDFNQLEQRIEHLCNDENARKEVELKLTELDSNEAYYLPEIFSKKIPPFFGKATGLYIRIAPFLIIALTLLLITAPSGLWIFLLVIQLVANAGVHYGNKKNILAFTQSLPQVVNLCNVAQWLAKEGHLEKTEVVETSLSKVLKLKKALGMVNFQNKVADDPTNLFYMVNEWIRILFLTEPLYFLLSINKVNKYQAEIKVLFVEVARVDFAISVQSVREGLPYYCRPEFTGDTSKMSISKLYHPLIDGCIANSIIADNSKVVLVTGSNMSGKTTFIRAVAINALFAQTINTCCAESYQSPPLKILTSIHMSDDLYAKQSYFQAEALAILNIVNHCSADQPVKSLVIIDEIFRGTNTIERISAAMSVLAYLVDNKNFVFVSTHDLELAAMLGNNTVYSFEETMEDGKLVFDYKIKEGVLKNKNGIAVLQRLGYPDSIIESAYKASQWLWDKYQV